MMCCIACELNSFVGKVMYNDFEFPSTDERLIKVCRKPFCPRALKDNPPNAGQISCLDCLHRKVSAICPQDNHVLALIGNDDSFAERTVHHTLDTLVACKNSHLTCELFQAANPEIREVLWDRILTSHCKSLFLLNPLFEKYELAPLEPGEIPDCTESYRRAVE